MNQNIHSRLARTAMCGAIALALAACGGGGAGGQGTSGNPSQSGTDVTPGSTDTPSGSQTQPVTMTISQTEVTIGGAVTVTATVKNAAGSPVSGAVVTFQSSDLTKALLNPAIGTATTDANGVASITVEGIAAGQVNINASVDVSGTRQAGSVALGVGGTESRNVSFVGASSQTLTISGTGGPATSELTFKVLNQAGVPIKGAQVTFAPSVTTGGLNVAPLTATSGDDGSVKTVVTAGTIPTPVRVAATVTINGSTTTVQSSQLSISSGLPSQNFFSLSVETFNIDGCDFDGSKTKVNARMGDQFGNPVPDGTTVNFISEGGRIGASSVGSCQTANGVCSVDLESQEFRPHDCRVSIMAYAAGQESFVDTNSNGIYNPGEPFTDLADAFLKVQPGFLTHGYGPADRVFTSAFDSSTDVTRFDLTDPAVFSAVQNPLDTRQADRLIRFVNTGQTTPVADGVWGQAHVRGYGEVVFSARSGELVMESGAPSFAGCGATPTSTSFVFRLVDRNGNPFAAGSTVAAEGVGAAVNRVLPAAVPSTSAYGGTYHTIQLSSDVSHCAGGASAGAPGVVYVTYTPVGGVGYVVPITVNY